MDREKLTVDDCCVTEIFTREIAHLQKNVSAFLVIIYELTLIIFPKLYAHLSAINIINNIDVQILFMKSSINK